MANWKRRRYAMAEPYGGELQRDLIEQVLEGCRRLGLSQSDLAFRSGVGQGNISYLLSGQRGGSLVTWNKLLRAVEDDSILPAELVS